MTAHGHQRNSLFHEVTGPVGETFFNQGVVNPRTFDADEIAAEAMEELRQFPIQQGQGTLRVFFQAADHAGADVGGNPDFQRAIGDGFFP